MLKVFCSPERLRNVQVGIENVKVPNWNKPLTPELEKGWKDLMYYSLGSNSRAVGYQPFLQRMWDKREELSTELEEDDLGFRLDYLEFLLAWQLGLPYNANHSFAIYQHLENSRAIVAIVAYTVLAVSGVVAVLTLGFTFLYKIGVRIW